MSGRAGPRRRAGRAARATLGGLAAVLPVGAAVALLGTPGPAPAVTFAMQGYTCPIDGQPFEQGLPTPGRPLGSRLDLKPWGPVIAPAVLPVCPGNRFVLYKRAFSDDELARLRAFVASPAWPPLRDGESDYARVAHLRRALGDDPVDVAFAWLYATWEVDEDPPRYARYAAEALAAADAALTAPRPDGPADGETRLALRLVTVELERRLGHFDAAAARLRALADLPGFADGVPAAIRRQQQALVDARDAAPHRMAPPGPGR